MSSWWTLAEAALTSRTWRRTFGASVLAALIALNPESARAQSAADKATARELAADGIKKYNAGDAEAARVLLEKAQALYDAPIHLLYLARAHEKLGNLVEAAESYRVLMRTKLDDGAPLVFRKAQEDGAEELEKLEPRIARLTITVKPEPEGLRVTVDGKDINTAALSVPRATNPGTRKVKVEAPGYVSAEKEVTLAEGGENTVAIELGEAEGEQASVARGRKTSSGDEMPDDQVADEGSGEAETVSGPFGFIVGVRVGGFVPLGLLEPERDMSRYWQPGIAGRGEIGFRFARYFGIKGYYGLGEVAPGSAMTEFAKRQVTELSSRNRAGVADAGVAVLATMDPRKVGGFGEIGLSFLHRYSWSQVLTNGGSDVCTNKAKYDGFGVRVGGGMNIPLAKIFTLVPAVDVTLGQLNKRTADFGCVDTAEFTIGPAADAEDEEIESALHYQIFLGLGGDFHFGDGLFQ